MESLKSDRYHYDFGPMAVFKYGLTRFRAVEVDYMFEQRKIHLLLKNEFSLAIFIGRHCRCSIQKLAASG